MKRAAVLYGPGTNCHIETKDALGLVGIEAKVVNITDLMTGADELTNYDATIVPGGFSWGDHFGSGRVFAIHLVERLGEQLFELLDRQVPILGICNGFQVLVETGLLPDRTIGDRRCALLQNSSARFESRWVELLVSESDCMWTQGLEGRILRMPVAHGEGRLFWKDGQPITPAFYYAKDGQPTTEYSWCPSGSPQGIAGICTNLILGMMPHPERASLELQGSTDGLEIFRNLARYLRV